MIGYLVQSFLFIRQLLYACTVFRRSDTRFETILCHKMARLFRHLNLRKCKGILTLYCIWQVAFNIRFFWLLSELSQIDSPGVFIGAKFIQVCGDDWFGGALRWIGAVAIEKCRALPRVAFSTPAFLSLVFLDALFFKLKVIIISPVVYCIWLLVLNFYFVWFF